MKIFLDASSLIKLYHYEDGTELLDKIIEQSNIEGIFLSEITKIEFTSAIWNKVRTKDLTSDKANQIISVFQKDYTNYTFIALDSELISSAKELIIRYGIKGLRTLDSIQLASMIKVKSALAFAVTADDLLKSLIETEGIQTK